MNKELFLREFIDDIWNKKNIEKVKKYVHSEYRIHLDTADPWEGKILNDTEFKERLNYSFDSFPDMHFEITSAIEDANHVAITWILTGTNSGPIAEYQATNKRIETKGMSIYYFKDGLISGHSQVFDRTTVMKQLGFKSQ
jgi:steroid delta-isomerase-like uncharacterized protein